MSHRSPVVDDHCLISGTIYDNDSETSLSCQMANLNEKALSFRTGEALNVALAYPSHRFTLSARHVLPYEMARHLRESKGYVPPHTEMVTPFLQIIL